MGAELDALGLEHLADRPLAHREGRGGAVDGELDVVRPQRGGEGDRADERERCASGEGGDQDLGHCSPKRRGNPTSIGSPQPKRFLRKSKMFLRIPWMAPAYASTTT